MNPVFSVIKKGFDLNSGADVESLRGIYEEYNGSKNDFEENLKEAQESTNGKKLTSYEKNYIKEVEEMNKHAFCFGELQTDLFLKKLSRGI